MFTLVFVSPLTFSPTFLIFSVYRFLIVLSKARILLIFVEECLYLHLLFLVTMVLLILELDLDVCTLRQKTGFTHNKIMKNAL